MVKRRLLVVEDDRSTILALKAIFERKGWDVWTARDVAGARRLINHNPDWIILDLMLPGEDGTTLLAEVRKANSAIRVAVTTGTEDMSRLQAAAGLKPDVLMRKPINLAELIAAMGR